MTKKTIFLLFSLFMTPFLEGVQCFGPTFKYNGLIHELSFINNKTFKDPLELKVDYFKRNSPPFKEKIHFKIINYWTLNEDITKTKDPHCFPFNFKTKNYALKINITFPKGSRTLEGQNLGAKDYYLLCSETEEYYE